MRTVTITRKPCSEGSTTANVVEHQAGAINIDETRIRYVSEDDLRETKSRNPGTERRFVSNVYDVTRPMQRMSPSGRWPANVIFQHRPDCHQTGTTTAPGYTINRWTDGAKPFGGGAGHEYESDLQPDERVAMWDCVDGCPVRGLGEQSGECPVSGSAAAGRPASRKHSQQSIAFGQWSEEDAPAVYHSDTGTAARYFKQVQELDMNEIPQELWDYLVTLISPPPSCDPVIIADPNLGGIDFSKFGDRSVHGMITVGNPERHMEEIDRVLKPGAHLLLIAPDEERTGHTGACAVEDYGFEIRDAIALLDEPGEFHYVAKASSSERNAGMPPLAEKQTVERWFPKEDADPEWIAERLDAGLSHDYHDSWDEGVPRDAFGPDDEEFKSSVGHELLQQFEPREVDVTKTHLNNHPTCKPVKVMERLLADVPKDQGPVVDPFMGSGTTGIACLRTGHDFVGIDQDGGYMKIADHRVRHWDRAIAAWDGADIESEAVLDEDDDPVSLEDFFGG